jgi:two-component system chemotaxis response regulator CheY
MPSDRSPRLYAQLKILLVDNNRYMRTLLAEILRAIGVVQVLEAADGVEGLALMGEQAVDLVITDLSMQPLDGIDFVRLLRRSLESPGRQVPVIMLTGNSTVSRVTEARDAGVDEFLAKPLDARAVVERVQWVIANPRPYVTRDGYVGPDRRRRTDPDFRGPWRRATDRRAF